MPDVGERQLTVLVRERPLVDHLVTGPHCVRALGSRRARRLPVLVHHHTGQVCGEGVRVVSVQPALKTCKGVHLHRLEILAVPLLSGLQVKELRLDDPAAVQHRLGVGVGIHVKRWDNSRLYSLISAVPVPLHPDVTSSDHPERCVPKAAVHLPLLAPVAELSVQHLGNVLIVFLLGLRQSLDSRDGLENLGPLTARDGHADVANNALATRHLMHLNQAVGVKIPLDVLLAVHISEVSPPLTLPDTPRLTRILLALLQLHDIQFRCSVRSVCHWTS